MADREAQIKSLRDAAAALPPGEVRDRLERTIGDLTHGSSGSSTGAESTAPVAANVAFEAFASRVSAWGATSPFYASPAVTTSAGGALAIAVHAAILTFPLTVYQTGSSSGSAPVPGFAPAVASVGKEVGVPSGWHAPDGTSFSFMYGNDLRLGNQKVHASIAVLAGVLVVHVTAGSRESSAELSLADYTTPTPSATAEDATDPNRILLAWRARLQPLQAGDKAGQFTRVITRLVEDVVPELARGGGGSVGGSSAAPHPRAPAPGADDTGRGYEGGYGHPGPSGYPSDPRSGFDRDLYPDFGSAVPGGLFHPPGSGFGGGGGSWVGPDHPLFGGGGGGGPMPIPGVPPGARYDPIFPLGVDPTHMPGIGRGRGGVPGRGGGRGGVPQGPAPDHLRPPPDNSDFF